MAGRSGTLVARQIYHGSGQRAKRSHPIGRFIEAGIGQAMGASNGGHFFRAESTIAIPVLARFCPDSGVIRGDFGAPSTTKRLKNGRKPWVSEAA
jgi:hypothetical protein